MKKTVFFITLFVISLIILEGLGWAIIFLKEKMVIYNHPKKTLYEAQNITPSKFIAELNYLYGNGLKINENRWYSLENSYAGQYHHLDEYGFRNDTKQTASNGVGVYGGSTIYGVTNLQESTIPSFLQSGCLKKKPVFNFGVGGYSSQSELQVFIETIRIKQYSIKEAIFYDGVNEVYRHIEKLQDNSVDKKYEMIGYPFMDAIKTSNTNLALKNSGLFYYKSSLVYLYNKYIFLTSQKNNINYLPLNDDQLKDEAKRIIDIYEQNIKDINSIAKVHGIKAYFFWQPSIFTISSPHIPPEYQQFISQSSTVSKLFTYASAEIDKRPSLKNVTNLAGAFNKSNINDGFYDPVHVTGPLNKIVADAMCKSLH